ncbi:NADH-quinone oxidoreductase subunit NuoF [Hydrogenimonas urashimensis]|uniref:NADH-quinone oxidoreductase subunit NuoF n=1 Tax=Hydrogenimonas urashimensis TaxID=2740515 RepID=UPI0019164223|nr:NADH-quinone oxidoreductase subunit NuoF [Hydrogenimonas urashimensis]
MNGVVGGDPAVREVKIVSRRFDLPDSHRLEVALEHGAYKAVEKAFANGAKWVMDEIEASGLRGKGGGGALACGKWKLTAEHPDPVKILTVNCDESEPGTFKDRQVITKDPHLLIEGIILTCYAIGAHDAYIYIRGEYHTFQKVLQRAVDEAYEAEILGEKVMGHGYRVDVTIHRGAGAYICGEKSALLESMEGKRGHPRLKPHKKEPEWYFGKPTLVNNVETIATVPFIVEQGAEAYRAFGTEKSPGAMLFALSGHVNRPGVYEAEFGTPMWRYIEHFGGGVKDGKRLKAVIPGGASTPILTAEEVMEAKLDYESMRSMGSSLGTGGMIVMDESVDMVAALKNLLEFYHHESCGQCTPCREGTGWVDAIVASVLAGEGGKEDIDKLLDIAWTMNGKTICVFAPAVSGVIDGFVTKFRSEFVAYLRNVK